MIFSAYDCYINNAWNGLSNRDNMKLTEKWTKKFWHSAQTGCISVTVPREPQEEKELKQIENNLFLLGYKLIWHETYIEIFFV